MNKAYLLIVCLLLSSFTGCIETEDNDETIVVEESDETTTNQNNEANNTADNTNNTVDETNNTVETELVKGWNEGDFAYNINFTDKEGDHFELYDMSSDFVLLTFSASWSSYDSMLFGWKANSYSWQKNAANNLTDIVIVIQDYDGGDPSQDHLRDLHAQYPNSGIMTKDALLMNGTTAWEVNNFIGFPSMILLKKNNEGNLVIDSIHIGMDGITTVLEKIGGVPDKILGCTDSTANNYNIEATEDDGTCAFNFQPKDRDELKRAVDEWIANSTDANSTYGDINTWDTSLVTDMSALFYYNQTFNDDISNWDVSSVTTTEKMFKFAEDFNQDLSGWDVSNVVYMNEMFYYATDFNQDIESWDVSSVTDMEGMFFAATDFNQDLVGWDVSKVTDTNGMFYAATSFNGDISHWDTSSVTKLNSMFYAASSFNQDISGWDVSNVDDWYGMNSMFYGAENFNQDISQWDVSNVNNMYGMFYNARSFNQDLSNWDVSGSTNLNDMFEGTDDLSDSNKCEIHNSFSSNDNWNYDWDEYCSDE